jgi:general secretion pathway protein I
MNTSNRPTGFTLIEVMVALAVLAIGFTGLLGLRNRDIATAAYASRLTDATLLANEKIVQTSVGDFPAVGVRTGGAEGYRWIEEVRPTPFDAIRELTVTVSWQEGGHEEEVHLTTYLFGG